MAKTKVVEFVSNCKDYEVLRNLIVDGLNRKVEGSSVEALVVSMKEDNFLGCIIAFETCAFGKLERVNIDGQHRIAAAKKAGIPFNYIVYSFENKKDDTKENLVKIIARLNSVSRKWTPVRYLDVYANLNFPEYVTMREIQKGSPLKLTLTDLQNIFLFGCGGKEVKMFKSGEMVFSDIKRSEKILEALTVLKDAMPKYSYVRRSLFTSLKEVSTSKIIRFANAIVKAAKLETLPQEEKTFFSWVEEIRKNEFGK